MQKQLVITISYDDERATEDDVADTLDHISKQVGDGYVTGFDRNDYVAYHYETKDAQ